MDPPPPAPSCNGLWLLLPAARSLQRKKVAAWGKRAANGSQCPPAAADAMQGPRIHRGGDDDNAAEGCWWCGACCGDGDTAEAATVEEDVSVTGGPAQRRPRRQESCDASMNRRWSPITSWNVPSVAASTTGVQQRRPPPGIAAVAGGLSASSSCDIWRDVWGRRFLPEKKPLPTPLCRGYHFVSSPGLKSTSPNGINKIKWRWLGC